MAVKCIVISLLVAALLATASPLLAQPQRVAESADSAGGLALSPNGRWAAFSQLDGPLLTIYDTVTGEIRRPLASQGAGEPLDSLAFTSSAQSLLFVTSRDTLLRPAGTTCTPPGEDCNGARDVFELDLLRPPTRRLSLTCFNEESVGDCYEAVGALEGDAIAMLCTGDDLVVEDHNELVDVFYRDERVRFTFRVNRPTVGGEANGPTGHQAIDGVESPSLGISLDGRYVAFVSAADNLVPDDENDALDVFVHDFFRGTTERVSETVGGLERSSDSGARGLGLSSDGRYVVYSADGAVFVQDRDLGPTRVVSARDPDCTEAPGTSWQPAISADGLRITFLADDPCLDVPTEQRPNGAAHLYRWDRSTGELALLDANTDGVPADAPVTRYRLSSGGDAVLLDSEATDLTAVAPPDDASHLYVVPTVADRDGDALPDAWEVDGLDFDGDGVIDLDLPALGADPDHRDLFIEYDYLFASDEHTHELSTQVVDWLVAAFAAAPLDNPDGEPGITLHLDLGAADAIIENGATRFIDGIRELDTLKAQYFGDEASRALDEWPQMREARRAVYRYGIVGHLLRGMTSSGLGELPGDDFLVTLGAFHNGVGTAGQQAGTFMHEIGHTLGLRHGGHESLNCKPNYLSVMSYSFQMPDPVPGRPLDYSGQALAPLLEHDLAEAPGIGGPSDWTTIYGPPQFTPMGFVLPTAPADGPIDWSADGDTLDVGVTRNLNDMPSLCFSGTATETMVGHDDWSALWYNVRGTSDWVAGLHHHLERDELTAEQLQAVREVSRYGDDAAPWASPGPAGAVPEGSLFLLDGSASFDPEGRELTASWAQSDGPAARFDSPGSLRLLAFAPWVDADASMRFELSVYDGRFWSAPAFVTIDVIDVTTEHPAASSDGGAVRVPSDPAVTPHRPAPVETVRALVRERSSRYAGPDLGAAEEPRCGCAAAGDADPPWALLGLLTIGLLSGRRRRAFGSGDAARSR